MEASDSKPPSKMFYLNMEAADSKAPSEEVLRLEHEGSTFQSTLKNVLPEYGGNRFQSTF
jgi:hypothetical protein